MATPMTMPRVSIGIPVYNGERFLEETLQSLLRQTYIDFEVLISDNASTDGTLAICEQYAAMDPRVRYFRNPINLGADGNFRRLVDLAQAPYFKLANADDLCIHDLIQSCVDILECDPEVVLSFGKTKLIDAIGNEIRPYEDNLHLRSQNVVERFDRVISRIRMTNALQGVTRTALLKKLIPRFGGYEGADLVLLAAMALYGQFHEIPRTLFFRRMHNMSFTAITNADEKQQYIDPAKKSMLSAYLTRIYYGYLREITAAPLSILVKMRLLSKLVRSLVSIRGDYRREVFGVTRSLLRKLLRT